MVWTGRKEEAIMCRKGWHEGKKEVTKNYRGWADQYCRLVILERVIGECNATTPCVLASCMNDSYGISFPLLVGKM